ncbi:MAG: hypothetical protein J6W50_02590 [Bacteroidaceae bacterium]|nr:hypothetical protein [Bacteroidaceae bacterium]
MNYFDQYCDTLRLLAEGQLLEAIRKQKDYVSELQNWELMDEIVKTEETYALMLKYFAQGMDDERRRDIYDDVVERTLAVAEKIKRVAGWAEATTPYYSKLRTVARQGRTLQYYSRRLQAISGQQLFHDILDSGQGSMANGQSSMVNGLSRSSLVEELFDYIWVAGILSAEDRSALSNLLSSSVLTTGEKMWMVSALTLSLLQYYDVAKLQLLATLVTVDNGQWPIADGQSSTDDTSDEALIRCRAIVGISLAAMYYKHRFAVSCPQIKLPSAITFVILQLQYMVQYQTRRVRQTFDNDFMTLLNQMRGQITDLNELKDLLEDEDPEMPPAGIDPEVIRAIQSRLKQATDMAHRGLDMMYGHFRQLKSYPFFRETRSWLKPTLVPTPDFEATLGKLGPLLNYSRMCDSDIHSMAATMASMPQTFGQMIASQMEELDLQADAEANESLGREERGQKMSTFMQQYSHYFKHAGDTIDTSIAYATSYLQDLYRLFTIRMGHEEEGNPLSLHNGEQGEALFLFLDSPLIRDGINGADAAVALEYAFNNRLYRHAIALHETLSTNFEQTTAVKLRLAFSHAMLHDSHSAVEVYRQCEELPPEHLLVYAGCLMECGQPKEAIREYEILFSGDDKGISLYPYAVALSQNGRLADACEVLYQEDYHRPDQIKVIRLLAWCTLRSSSTGERTAVISLYNRLLGMSPLRSSDWLNAGHAALANGDVQQALDYYRKAEVTDINDDDCELLISLGVPQLTLRLVLDTLKL